MKRLISAFTLLCFMATGIMGLCPVFAKGLVLPAPGQMVALSPAFSPVVLKGIKLDPQNPFRFHFYVDSGDSTVIPAKAGIQHQEQLKSEAQRLIKYFLASLTIPEQDLWVNLSPYEKNRIVPKEFGQTEMGRDLLAQDYLLKQITASLIYPESTLGKEFWQKVYAQAQAKYGTTDIPVNTFNKVWIVPDKAVVYENNGVAFVLENHLKVMLEEDYLAKSKGTGSNSLTLSFPRKRESIPPAGELVPVPSISLASQIVREIIIPALTKEVNEGQNFAQLRQVFYSLILATWYKSKIKDSILNKVYSNQKKTGNLSSPNVSVGDPEHIYQMYLQAFKKGVFNYIKEEDVIPEPSSVIPAKAGIQNTTPRKYFSGGVTAMAISNVMTSIGPQQITPAQLAVLDKAQLTDVEANVSLSQAQTVPVSNGFSDSAMIQRTVDLNLDIATFERHLQMIRFISARDGHGETEDKMLINIYYELFQSLDGFLKDINQGEVHYIYPFAGPDIIPNLFSPTIRINNNSGDFNKGREKVESLLVEPLSRDISSDYNEPQDAFSMEAYESAFNMTPKGKRVLILKNFNWKNQKNYLSTDSFL